MLRWMWCQGIVVLVSVVSRVAVVRVVVSRVEVLAAVLTTAVLRAYCRGMWWWGMSCWWLRYRLLKLGGYGVWGMSYMCLPCQGLML